MKLCRLFLFSMLTIASGAAMAQGHGRRDGVDGGQRLKERQERVQERRERIEERRERMEERREHLSQEERRQLREDVGNAGREIYRRPRDR